MLENHFHLILEEIRENGISVFMKRIGTGIGTYFNIKYHEVGRIFQGPYKSKIIKEETYLRYLSVYVQVKNVFELYPGGDVLGELFNTSEEYKEFAKQCLGQMDLDEEFNKLRLE